MPLPSSTLAAISGGFNHNIAYRGITFHVQTEVSPSEDGRVDTHVFVGGRIIATRRSSFADAPRAATVLRGMKDQHREMLRDLISDRLSIPQDLCGLTPPRPRVAPPAPPAPALTVVTNERATPSTRVVEPPTLALVPSPTQVSAGEPTLTDTTAPVAATAPAPVAAVTPAPPMSRPTSTPASAPLEIQATARAASAPASARAVRARSSSSPTRRIRAAIARINALLSCDDDGCPLRALGVAIAVLLGSGVERYISNDALEMLKTQQGRLIRELVRSAAYFDDSLRSDCVALTALLSQQLAAPAANA